MDKKNRLKQLSDFVGKDKVIFLKNLIDEIVFMEGQIEELKKLPFIKCNKNNPCLQKKTEASKLYLSMMAQYTQDLKALSYLSGNALDEETISPLRQYFMNKEETNGSNKK